jgi:hypothetical protein
MFIASFPSNLGAVYSLPWNLSTDFSSFYQKLAVAFCIDKPNLLRYMGMAAFFLPFWAFIV